MGSLVKVKPKDDYAHERKDGLRLQFKSKMVRGKKLYYAVCVFPKVLSSILTQTKDDSSVNFPKKREAEQYACLLAMKILRDLGFFDDFLKPNVECVQKSKIDELSTLASELASNKEMISQ